jgi:hypothetical protein
MLESYVQEFWMKRYRPDSSRAQPHNDKNLLRQDREDDAPRLADDILNVFVSKRRPCRSGKRENRRRPRGPWLAVAGESSV